MKFAIAALLATVSAYRFEDEMTSLMDLYDDMDDDLLEFDGEDPPAADPPAAAPADGAADPNAAAPADPNAAAPADGTAEEGGSGLAVGLGIGGAVALVAVGGFCMWKRKQSAEAEGGYKESLVVEMA